MTKEAPMSLSAYAARRGVTPKAVSKAVAAGRLVASVVRDERGEPKIADPDLADREWEANTRHRAAALVAAEFSAAGPAAAPSATDRLLELRIRHQAAQAELAEHELARRKGKYILIDDARRDVSAANSIVRTRLLAVPSRLGQRGVPRDVVAMVDDEIREALTELADGKGFRRVSDGGGDKAP